MSSSNLTISYKFKVIAIFQILKNKGSFVYISIDII